MEITFYSPRVDTVTYSHTNTPVEIDEYNYILDKIVESFSDVDNIRQGYKIDIEENDFLFDIYYYLDDDLGDTDISCRLELLDDCFNIAFDDPIFSRNLSIKNTNYQDFADKFPALKYFIEYIVFEGTKIFMSSNPDTNTVKE